MIIDKSILKKGFSSIGISSGMKLAVHSSLSSFGHVDGGADSVIDALCELITESGTLIMPSFNHGEPYQNGNIFDIRSTRTKNGIIPDTFWRRPDVIRSMNPTHSFAVWGSDAHLYADFHQSSSVMGFGSPLHKLMEDGGHCLLIGTGYRTNTFHHVVETCIGSPCLSERGEVYPVTDYDGYRREAHTWSWRSDPCPKDDSGPIYADAMRSVDKRVVIGSAEIIIYKLSEGYEIIKYYLENNINGLSPCKECQIRPRKSIYSV